MFIYSPFLLLAPALTYQMRPPPPLLFLQYPSPLLSLAPLLCPPLLGEEGGLWVQEVGEKWAALLPEATASVGLTKSQAHLLQMELIRCAAIGE